MGLLVVCPACLHHLDVQDLDATQVAALGGALCTCVKCNAAISLDAQGRVVASEALQRKLYGYPDAGTGAVAIRTRGDSVQFRIRGVFQFVFGKRVTVTNEHVEVRLRWRGIRHVWPIAHVVGVFVVQHAFLDTMSSMWGTYLSFEDGSISLAGFSKLERAIDHASAINRLVIARKPTGDPYRGLLAAGESG